jgi:hypothetical protein
MKRAIVDRRLVPRRRVHHADVDAAMSAVARAVL